jgi:hypothetical protein
MKDRGIVAGTLAVIVVVAFCGFAIYVGIMPLPEANQHFIDIALGALVGQFANVIGYYFGSSRTADQRQPQRPPATVPLPKMPVPPSNDFHQKED